MLSSMSIFHLRGGNKLVFEKPSAPQASSASPIIEKLPSFVSHLEGEIPAAPTSPRESSGKRLPGWYFCTIVDLGLKELPRALLPGAVR